MQRRLAATAVSLALVSCLTQACSTSSTDDGAADWEEMPGRFEAGTTPFLFRDTAYAAQIVDSRLVVENLSSAVSSDVSNEKFEALLSVAVSGPLVYFVVSPVDCSESVLRVVAWDPDASSVKSTIDAPEGINCGRDATVAVGTDSDVLLQSVQPGGVGAFLKSGATGWSDTFSLPPDMVAPLRSIQFVGMGHGVIGGGSLREAEPSSSSFFSLVGTGGWATETPAPIATDALVGSQGSKAVLVWDGQLGRIASFSDGVWTVKGVESVHRASAAVASCGNSQLLVAGGVVWPDDIQRDDSASFSGPAEQTALLIDTSTGEVTTETDLPAGADATTLILMSRATTVGCDTYLISASDGSVYRRSFD